MLHTPARPGDLVLLEQAAFALCNVLARVCHNKEWVPHTSRKIDIGDVVQQVRGPAACVPRLARALYTPLFTLLEEGSQDGKRGAAWLVHFIAVCTPSDSLKWTAEQRKRASLALVGALGTMFADVRIGALHGLSMSMQRDVMFRADVAQAGAVPLFLKLLREDDLDLVTAAAGALHALVQGHKAYVPWIVQVKGLNELMAVVQKLPVEEPSHRLALLQVLWTLECCAMADEATGKLLLAEGLLPVVFSIITQAHGVSDEVQSAAAMVLAGLVAGKDQKEPRPRLRSQVIDELSVPALEDFRDHGGPVLKLVASQIVSHATPQQIQRGREGGPRMHLGEHAQQPQEPAAPDAGSTSSAPAVPTATGAPTPPPKASLGALGARAVMSNFVGKEALVIGCGNYENLAKVKHAVRDAQDLASSFKMAGFRVLTAYDPNSDLLKATMLQFEQRVMAGHLALIVFSGHGAVYGGKHFFLPIDTKVVKPHAEGSDGPSVQEQEDAIKLKAGPLDGLLEKLAAKGVRHTMVLLDACRKCKLPGAAAAAEAAAPTSAAGVEGAAQEPQRGADSSSGAGADSSEGSPAAPAGPHPPAGPRRPAPPASKRASAIGGLAGPRPSRIQVAALQKRESFGRESAAAAAGSAAGGKLRAAAARVAAGTGISGARALRKSTSLKACAGMVALAAKAMSNKAKAVEDLVWDYDGIRASLLFFACEPGTEALGNLKTSTSSKNSVFTEHLLRFLFAKHVSLRQAMDMVVKTIKDVTAGAQIPGYRDNKMIGHDFKLS